SRCHSRLLSSFLSYFTDPATTPIYTLSLHDALPISSLGLDLAPISEVRAMAGRVIEIRLSNPVPMLLQLLAQPELTLSRGGAGGAGDMAMERPPAHCSQPAEQCAAHALLTMKPPAERGIPEAEDWRE